MLKAETITKLKSILPGFDIDKMVAAAVHAEEQDFTFPEDVTVLNAADLATRDANTKAEGHRAGVAEGKTAGLEIAGKTIAKKLALPDTVNTKSLDDVATAIQEANTGGDAALKDQVKLLQADKEKLASEKEAIIKEKEALAFDNELISNFPPNRTADYSDNERLAIVKMNLTFEKGTDGKMVVKKGGEIITDPTTRSPIAPKDAINSLFTERKWVAETQTGGRGGGNVTTGNNTGLPSKASEARAEFKAKNPDLPETSAECTDYVAGIANKVGDSFEFD